VDLGEFAVTRLENSNRKVTLDEAVAIAAVLGVSLLHMLCPWMTAAFSLRHGYLR
jgi:hypothetical protein